MKLGLNLGCGHARVQSPNIQFINMDNNPATRAEVIRDIKRGLPWNDNTFDVVYCSHFLEHFGGEDFTFIMNDIHRVLKPNGELRILSPHRSYWGAWIDPQHKMFMDEHTFEPFWMPCQSHQEMGVMGWYEPKVIEVAEGKELRIVMIKVPGDEIKQYMNELYAKKEKGAFTPSDFINECEGKTFYKPGTNHEWNEVA